MKTLASVKNALLKPEFVFRPAQLLRRLRWKLDWKDRRGTVMLPWGLPLDIDASETIGMAITKIGVYDLIVPEAILRLCDPGETALDIGANIGMNTGVMALAVGPTGRVIAYEPHPTLNEGLRKTLESWALHVEPQTPEGDEQPPADWQVVDSITNIDLRAQALSDRSGTGTLKIPIDFNQNTGTASLADADSDHASEIQSIDVPVVSLDETFTKPDDKIGVLKIDIEGHEYAALRGAERLLSVGCIRDIIFEEHRELPTDVTRLLEEYGYHIFLLRKDPLRPKLIPTPCARPDALPNYLATLDPDRARQRFKKRGFLSLRKHPTQKHQ